MSEGWHQIIPPTDEEIAAFCEAEDIVRPGLDASEREVRSFASHLVVWLAEQRSSGPGDADA